MQFCQCFYLAFAVLWSFAIAYASPTPPPPAETLTRLDWSVSGPRQEYKLTIIPESGGARYQASVKTKTGNTRKKDGHLSQDEFDRFSQALLRRDPWNVKEGPSHAADASQFSMYVQSSTRQYEVKFHYPPDAAHLKFVEFMQNALPGRLEDQLGRDAGE